ncbi:MAG: hypothetical protein ABIO57_02495 [Candidatus Paceibacterota bacterium]
MSQNQYIATLEKQINALNRHIDAKIIKGQQYVEESRKHHALLRKLREQKRGFIGRVFPLFA